jgi:hypothetical protein
VKGRRSKNLLVTGGLTAGIWRYEFSDKTDWPCQALNFVRNILAKHHRDFIKRLFDAANPVQRYHDRQVEAAKRREFPLVEPDFSYLSDTEKPNPRDNWLSPILGQRDFINESIA